MFGGRHATGRCNDIQALRISTRKWVAPDCAGVGPGQRKTHAAAAVGNRIFIYGGHSGEAWLADLHILDFGTLQWDEDMGVIAAWQSHKLVVNYGATARPSLNSLFMLLLGQCSFHYRGSHPLANDCFTVSHTGSMALDGPCTIKQPADTFLFELVSTLEPHIQDAMLDNCPELQAQAAAAKRQRNRHSLSHSPTGNVAVSGGGSPAQYTISDASTRVKGGGSSDDQAAAQGTKPAGGSVSSARPMTTAGAGSDDSTPASASSAQDAMGTAASGTKPPAAPSVSSAAAAPAAAVVPARSVPVHQGGGLHTDVTVYVEGQSMRLHKMMLATRSEFFRAMFRNGKWKT